MSSVQRRVVFRREALAQLDELEDFVVAAGSPVAAADLVDVLVASCQDLAHFPLRGTARDDIRYAMSTYLARGETPCREGLTRTLSTGSRRPG